MSQLFMSAVITCLNEEQTIERFVEARVHALREIPRVEKMSRYMIPPNDHIGYGVISNLEHPFHLTVITDQQL